MDNPYAVVVFDNACKLWLGKFSWYYKDAFLQKEIM